TQAYLTLLQTYYVPWVQDWGQERGQCALGFLGLAPADQIQQLPACRPLLTPELAAGKTLLAQLATAQPPTRWQAQPAALTQALQAADGYDTQRLHAIDAQSVSQYLTLANRAPEVALRFCQPISAFNVVLVARHTVLLPQPAPTCADT